MRGAWDPSRVKTLSAKETITSIELEAIKKHGWRLALS
jgi:hypothetical protein